MHEVNIIKLPFEAHPSLTVNGCNMYKTAFSLLNIYRDFKEEYCPIRSLQAQPFDETHRLYYIGIGKRRS